MSILSNLFGKKNKTNPGFKSVSQENWLFGMPKLPDFGIEVIGYNESWVDEDYNPDGTRVCFLNDDYSWTYASWCGQHDEWHTRNSDDEGWEHTYQSAPSAPTHWIEKPKFLI